MTSIVHRTNRIEGVRWGRRATGLALVALCLATTPVIAQEEDQGATTEGMQMEVPVEQPTAVQQPQLRMEGDSIHITLQEAIDIALQRNLSVVISRHNLAASEGSILANKGIYDLGGQLDLTTSDSKSPTASQLVGATVEQQQQKTWNLAFSQLTPLGGTGGLSWDNFRSETNSLDSTFNPIYSSSLALFYNQPLLRNLGRRVTERNLTIARTNREISMQDFELQVTDVVQQVIDAYWNLVEAQEQLKVSEESLKLAEELHAQNKIRVKVGTLAPLELVQSEAGVATRKEEIIRARSAVGDAADQLRLLLNLDQGPAWSASIDPETDPETAAVSVDLPQAIQEALSTRPELMSQALQVENRKVDKIFAENQKKPRVDLQVSYNVSGLGGTQLRRDPVTRQIISTIPGGYSDALSQVTGRDFDSWRVGVTVAMPIQNRTAKGNAAIADERLASATTQLAQVKQQLVTEVRTAARGVETAEQQITSARVSRRLAEKNLDAERKKYDNGMSTSYQVLQIQNDLALARSREVSAVVGYRRALAAYYKATGKLLNESGIDVMAEDNASE